MKNSIFILLLISTIGCSQNPSFKDVGDIPFDELIDDKNFKICNEKNIKQYYVRNSSDSPPNYKGEKKALEESVLGDYEFPNTKEENGFVTIRFIVNCFGETGRFRIEEMNFAYEPRKFDDGITTQLLKIVKGLNDWIPRKRKDKNYDFYQYLTFKIRNGQIIKILP